MDVFSMFQLTGMCKTRGKKMAENLSTVRSNTRLLDDLLAWLNGAETTLINVDQEPIPGDIQVIHDLIKDHQVQYKYFVSGLLFFSYTV